MERKGILAFGNWIVDHIKNIETYPDKNLLTIIKDQERSIGGGPANISIDLAKMNVDFPIYAGGVIGNDTDGRYILETLQNNNIDSEYMRLSNELSTAYTDVINGQKDSTRTFFHFLGANSILSFKNFKNITNNSKICYLGYLLLLKGLEEPDQEYGSIAVKSLAYLQNQGFLTAVDLVSNKETDKTFILQCLKYIDYLVINEIEAEIITGESIRQPNNSIDFEALKKACHNIIEYGVNKLVVVHFPEGALAVDNNLNITFEPSFKVDFKEIAGTVGAGDAFCAGVLYGIHENLDITETLKIGNANAWFNLQSPTATDGAVNINNLFEFIKTAEKNSVLT